MVPVACIPERLLVGFGTPISAPHLPAAIRVYPAFGCTASALPRIQASLSQWLALIRCEEGPNSLGFVPPLAWPSFSSLIRRLIPRDPYRLICSWYFVLVFSGQPYSLHALARSGSIPVSFSFLSLSLLPFSVSLSHLLLFVLVSPSLSSRDARRFAVDVLERLSRPVIPLSPTPEP